MENDCNGFGEDWNEDESGRKNVEVDGGDLGETVDQYGYGEGCNQDGIKSRGVGEVGGTDAFEEANSLFEDYSNGDEEERNEVYVRLR